MKKYFSINVLTLLILCVGITFSSCSKEGEGGDKKLVGTWLSEYGGEKTYLTFKSDGTGLERVEFKDEDAFLGLDVVELAFSWSAENGKLTVSMLFVGTIAYEIKGNSLYLHSDDEDPDVYKKVK